MSVIEVSEEERQLIINLRKNQSELIIKNIVMDNKHIEIFHRMIFKIRDNNLTVDTVDGTYDKTLGFCTSASGFYHHDLTKEDAKKLLDYLSFYIG